VSGAPRVSVAIALYNEQEAVPELLSRVRRVLDALPGPPHEMVFVDDGSTDRTLVLLSTAAAEDPRITVVALSRNFGHQAALSAALDYVTGDAVIIMDGDLQDSPEAIPKLVEEHLKGFDVVYVRRVGRKEGWLLRSSYFLFYRMMAVVANIRLPVDAGDFALLSRRVVGRLRETKERHRYLRGLRTWVGYRQTGIHVEREARNFGRTKYSSARLVGLALDGLISFSVAPLRAAAALGLLTIVVSSAFALYSLYSKIVLNQSPAGFTALIVVISFMSGVQLLFLGVIGEYLGRVYEEVKGRPQYVVDQIVRHPSKRAGTQGDSLIGSAMRDLRQ
jgi:polyisoprenyl-phosphate glycosyltransferase